MAKVTDVGCLMSIGRLVNQLTPFRWRVRVEDRRAGWSSADGAAAIQVAVDRHQLIVVVLVRCGALCIRVGRIMIVIHARVERSARGVLVVEAESVPNFLTHDVLALGGIVIGCCIEIGVVYFDGALSDVRAARDRDRGEPEPAVIAIGIVADFDASERCPATSGGGPSGDDSCVHDGGLGPVARGLAEMCIPVVPVRGTCLQVVAEFDGEGVAGARPVITAPGMVRVCSASGEKGEDEGDGSQPDDERCQGCDEDRSSTSLHANASPSRDCYGYGMIESAIPSGP